ncbi:hypothetical protein MUCCIDRAFT_79453 [Mucor lusitanicus CBS 277.49]|uniref:Dehydrogenase E1 component domain-containing protein n=1 Tax=Mucor lusitanicus CBS 277.49 TaxID=747725 RepID=A0A162MQM5_MUCCL|nr:hypothetical protein MUCCIDRAFT_79453 [Mucor lusitanicus CBS 277.49]
MGTAAEQSSASAEYYKLGDYIPGIHVNGDHRMSNPGTTYRTHGEIQNVSPTSDPSLSHPKRVIVDPGVAAEADLMEIDKETVKTVDDAQKEVEQSPEPSLDEFRTGADLPGAEPKYIRGRQPTIAHHHYH